MEYVFCSSAPIGLGRYFAFSSSPLNHGAMVWSNLGSSNCGGGKMWSIHETLTLSSSSPWVFILLSRVGWGAFKAKYLQGNSRVVKTFHLAKREVGRNWLGPRPISLAPPPPPGLILLTSSGHVIHIKVVGLRAAKFRYQIHPNQSSDEGDMAHKSSGGLVELRA
jgi:hypothetical protein